MDRDPFKVMAPARGITVCYRSLQCPSTVTSYIQEYNIQAEFFVKSAAVDTGVVAEIFCESELLPEGRVPFTNRVEDECVHGCTLMRDTFKKQVQEEGAPNGTNIVHVMTKNWDTYKGFDKGAIVEQVFFATMNGDRAETKLRGNVLALLPRPDVERDAAIAHVALQNICKGGLFKFVNVGLQVCRGNGGSISEITIITMTTAMITATSIVAI